MGVRLREATIRKKSALGSAASDVINKNELNNAIIRINDALNEISDEKERKRINKQAGQFVALAARSKAPRSTKPHYVYNTPKANKGVRAKRGEAERYRTTYLPGNLQLSIRTLSLRRSIRAIVGPRILRKVRAKVYGKNANNVNAFYAQMIYGSAKAFRDKVMIPALQAQEGRVTAYIKKEIEKLTRNAAIKNNLQ